MEIQDVRIYDPKSDGLDYRTYQEIISILKNKNERVAEIFIEGLHEKGLQSKVLGKGTLRDYLYGQFCYFDSYPRIDHVQFMNGRLFSISMTPETTNLIKKNSELNNSIILVYKRLTD